jgi:DNA-binding NtrC family response regulator
MNKLIFISSSLADIEKVKEFAKNNDYSLEHYSKEEWKKDSENQFENVSNYNNVAAGTENNHFSIVQLPNSNHSLQTMNEIKVEAIRMALLRAKGNASKAAEMLQIGRATLYRKIKEFGVDLESMRKDIGEKEYEPVLKKTA